MKNAIRLMETFIHHSIAAFDLMGADQDILNARSIIRWIKRQQLSAITERDLFNQVRSQFRTVDQMRGPLGILIERGYIRRLEVPKDGPGRKPSPLLLVRPQQGGDPT